MKYAMEDIINQKKSEGAAWLQRMTEIQGKRDKLFEKVLLTPEEHETLVKYMHLIENIYEMLVHLQTEINMLKFQAEN